MAMRASFRWAAGLLAGVALACLPVSAADPLSGAVRESTQASAHASAAAGHAIAASGRTVLGVSAIPLAVSGAALGAVGGVSATAAAESMRAANAPSGPLEISDEAITVIPPNEALAPVAPQLPK